MLSPAVPEDEPKRLAALRSLNLLFTPAEGRFDRITRLASRLLGTPIALVSLVGESRQWFKSAQGLDATETDRCISFCGHAILSEKMLVVEDALLDSRFADNPLVTGGPQIRFYAGQPLHGADGTRIGTLCVIDRVPRNPQISDRAACPPTPVPCTLRARHPQQSSRRRAFRDRKLPFLPSTRGRRTEMPLPFR